MRLLFIFISIFALILFGQKYLGHFQIFRLKKKIKNNPFIGTKQQDNSYDYKEKGYTISYRIKESLSGVKAVEWLSLKRRLTFIEEKILDIKRSLSDFFLYQRWVTLFRPSAVIVLMVSLIIFYLGMEQSFKRIEHFKWIAGQITGITPESIKYAGAGEFQVFGRKKRYLDGKEVDAVTISFNPLGWLFFSDAARINLWNPKLNKYLTYSFSINDKGDVWLGKKKEGQVYGRVEGNKIMWNEPAGTSRYKGHDIVVEDGKLRFIDE